MSGGFQTSVSDQPAPAVEGDFCDVNPRYTVDFGQGGAVAGEFGLVIGRACWAVAPADSNGVSASLNSFGTGPITGIVAREQQGLITRYLDDASMVIPEGFQVTAFSSVGLWVRNNGAAQAKPGQKAYATFADGKFTFTATGSPMTGASATGSTVTPETFSATGSIAGNVMTLSAVASGSIYPGSTVSGTDVASGSIVGQQLTPLLAGEVANGVGRYYVSIAEQTVDVGTAIAGTYGLLTIGTATGTFHVNDVLAASGAVVAGTTITANVTGAGGTGGTMVVNNNTNVTSQSISVAAVNVETSWTCRSFGLPGELVKITNSVTP